MTKPTFADIQEKTAAARGQAISTGEPVITATQTSEMEDIRLRVFKALYGSVSIDRGYSLSEMIDTLIALANEGMTQAIESTIRAAHAEEQVKYYQQELAKHSQRKDNEH